MSRSDSIRPLVMNALSVVRTAVQWITRILLTGFVIIMPFVLLGFLFGMALDFARGLLQPIITVLRWGGIIRMANFGIVGRTLISLGFYNDVFGFFVEFVAVLALLSTVVMLGVFASFRSGKRIMEYIDTGIAAIPGIGPVYKSFRRMGDIILESGLENFQSVKLIEFPHDDVFSIAFETNHAPESIRTSTGTSDMVTLFVPLAPNPVMGGFLVHVSRDRVFDVDMTVEEAARALITSGIAAGESSEEKPSLNPFHRMKQIRDTRDLIEETPIETSTTDDGSDDTGEEK